MPQLCLFISCVSNEFGNYRDAMRKDLSRPNLTTKIQEDFIAYGASTLQKLDDYIKNCEAVIHVCGNMTGSMANPLSLDYINTTYPDFGTRFPKLLTVLEGKEQLSYTQWEAWLAAYHKKTLLIAKPNEDAPRHNSYQLQTDQQEHQQSHIDRLRSNGHYVEILFSTQDELVKKLYQSPLLELLFKLPATKPINLPYHSIGSLFKGREHELEKIYSGLTNVHSGPTAIIGNTIHGLGGIGKTRLAVEYARRHENNYTALLFVTADSPESLFTNLASLSAKSVLDLPEQHAQEEQLKYDAVIQWLNVHTGWLLILDNADTKAAAVEVEKLFGQLHSGHLLITTRQAYWSSQVNPLPLDVLDNKAAASFLLERTAEKRRKTADDENFAMLIAEDLGYLALALEQAGAYITTRRLTLAQYRQAWQTNHDQVLEWYDERLMKYPSSVAVTWQTSVNQLTANARQLLDRLAWLAPDPIPESLLNIKAEEDSFDYYAALDELAEYSLVNRLDDPEFTIHRLIQDVTRRRQNKDVAQNTFIISLNWISKAFIGNPDDVRNWPVLEPLMPHVIALIRNTLRQGPKTIVESKLQSDLGVIYLAKAQYKKAEPLMRQALLINEQNFGENHPTAAILLNNLAQLLKDTNRLTEAEPLMYRALQIDKQSLGDNHPKVAIRLNNLAILLHDTNRLAEAEQLMHRALQINEQNFGKNHSTVATILNNLAQLLQDTNRLVEAEPLMHRALQIDEQNLGEYHPNVAIGLNNLAQLLLATNRLAEAELLMLRVLRINEQNFGENHPKVAIGLNNLALLLQDTTRLSEAEPLMRRACVIFNNSLGLDHPTTQTVGENYIRLLQDIGKSEEEIEITLSTLL